MSKAEDEWTVEKLNAVIARGGFACLGCEEPTTAEGQVCPACVKSGIWVENDTVFVTIEARF